MSRERFTQHTGKSPGASELAFPGCPHRGERCSDDPGPVKPSLKADGSGKIDMAWTGSGLDDYDCINYLVQRKPVSSGSWATIGCLTSASFSDTGSQEYSAAQPVAGSSYSYRVGHDGGYDCASTINDASDVVSVDPYTIITTTLGSGAITLAWTSITGATSYKVERKASGGSFALLTTATGTVTHKDTTGTAGTSYTYRVRAVVSTTDKSWSNEVTATFPVSTSCTGGVAAVLADPVPEPDGVSLTWSGGTWGNNCTEWVVLRGTGAAGSVASVGTVTTQATRTYKDTTAVAGTSYRYKVAQMGSTAESNEKTIDPYMVLTATAGSDRVNLAWTPISVGIRYEVQRDEDSGYVTLKNDVILTTFSDLTGTGDYRNKYRVRAGSGKAWSNVVTIDFPLIACVAPTAGTTIAKTDGVTLTWTGGDWGTACKLWAVYRNDTLVQEISSESTRTLHDTGAQSGTSTVYVVAGEHPDVGDVISSDDFKINYTVLKGTVAGSAITLTWDTIVSNVATEYAVERKVGSGQLVELASALTTSPYIDTSPVSGEQLRYRVKVTIAADVDYSGEAAITIAAVPDAPAKPTVALTQSGMQINWVEAANGGSPITGYRLTKSVKPVDGAWTSSAIDLAGKTAVMYEDMVVMNAHVYKYSVIAINDRGEGAPSPESDDTPSFDKPDAPTNLTAEVRDESGAVIEYTVAWSSSDDEIAAVTVNGLVTAISIGVATITATAGKATGIAGVEVR